MEMELDKQFFLQHPEYPSHPDVEPEIRDEWSEQYQTTYIFVFECVVDGKRRSQRVA